MSINRFFMYFGAKHELSRRYPAPLHDTIIEPFAGSAGYATRHHHKRVVLIDKDPVVVGLWSFLLRSTARDILALPELEDGQRVEELAICQEARWLIGRWIDIGAKKPANKRTPWAKENPHGTWGRTIRARLASQVGKIRHWQIIEGTYADAPDVEATWFIDPPYEKAGIQYTVGSAGIDFTHLGAWCRERQGQVIVCEEGGATWLPFRPFREINGMQHGRSTTSEVIWTNDDATQTQASA